MASYITDQWDEFVGRLRSARVRCPNCGDPIRPVVVTQLGMAIDVNRSDETTTRLTEVQFTVAGPTPNTTDLGYAVCLCPGCNTLMVLEVNWRYNFKVVWPLAGTEVSEDIALRVRAAVKDAKLAFAAGSVTGAIMSARVATARMTTDHKVSSLSELWKAKGLSPAYFPAANEPRKWGDMVTHKDFDPEDISLDDVADILKYLDIILSVIYVSTKEMDRLGEKRKKLENEPSPEDDGVVEVE